jgi:aldehyde:ferredoxin oxidoreductase
MDQAKKYYYTLMGWDPDTGIPLPEKVAELGIDYP